MRNSNLAALNHALPVKRNFVAVSALHVLVEQIEAYICRRSLHPPYENVTFAQVEIVREKLAVRRRRFPVKLLSDLTPEFRRLLYRPECRKIDMSIRTFFYISPQR